MSSWNAIVELKKSNEGNFVDSSYDSERNEYVMIFKKNDIKIPDYCYRAHGCIYDADEDIKVCRVQIL